jgi:predicted dehydrogenase
MTGAAEMDVDPVRVAVVGLGYWGPNLVRVLHDLPEAALIAVCDLRSEPLAAVTRRYPAVRATQRFEDLIEDPEIDAIAISTPVSSHGALAEAALAAGKHVFVEKPLTDSAARAEELVALAKREQRVLMPGHTFLYSAPVLMIRDLIASGELGDIHFITTSRVNLGLHQPDVSVTWDLGPHDFSILRYWLGELPASVSAVGRNCIFPDRCDVAFIALTFPSGAVAHVEISWLAPSKLRRTAVIGSKKMVVYDDTSNEPVRIFDSGVVPPAPQSFGEFKLAYRSGDIISPRISSAEPLVDEMLDFCRAVREGIEPRSSTAVGLDVVRICEATERAMALQRPVFADPA